MYIYQPHTAVFNIIPFIIQWDFQCISSFQPISC